MKKFCDINVVCDAAVYEMERHCDDRGYFEEIFSSRILDLNVKQINMSFSYMNVLRGIHVTPFAKLVHCVMGKIFDVVVDLREESKTYLRWYGVELTESNKLSLYIPPYCGHGFMAIEDSFVIYAQSGVYDPKVETSVCWHDPTLAVTWPSVNPIISKKDMLAPMLKESLYAKV